MSRKESKKIAKEDVKAVVSKGLDEHFVELIKYMSCLHEINAVEKVDTIYVYLNSKYWVLFAEVYNLQHCINNILPGEEEANISANVYLHQQLNGASL